MTRYYDDPPEGKLSQSEWERRNFVEIFDRFLEDKQFTINRNIECFVTYKKSSSSLGVDILKAYVKSRDTQYEEYLDTEEGEEFDRMVEEERHEKMYGE